jgi:porphobilinogen deaminase
MTQPNSDSIDEGGKILKYRIGTRGSKLALAQTELVKCRLEQNYPEHEFEIQIIQTKGDRIQNMPLDQIGDKGVFVREIEEKLLSGEVHIGVHSMKDMPSEPADGLLFTKAWKREDPRDVLVLREAESLGQLPPGAVIATGSRRREFQLKRLRPDIQITGIRGNIDTRLRKMEEQKLDGIVLAAAGLHRLGLRERISQYLEPKDMIPAPAQGTLALEIRQEDKQLRQLLDALSDAETEQEAGAERCFLKMVGGDCHLPVGACCEKTETGGFRMRVLYGNQTGERLAAVCVEGEDPVKLAQDAVAAVGRKMAGRVYLVGAGPGDPGLITVKGREAIRQADCILYDRLISPLLLEEAKPECEKIYVGKENHHHTMKQEEINRLLIKKAYEYPRVVRLKGGDVYVFGRGGEEGMALAEKGISFQVIPGLSSCTAGPAYAGIPVTHRGIAGGFHVVTAHDRKDQLAYIDFEAMARGRDTCIFLMGRSKIREITQGLMDGGMLPDTKAAVISHATTAKQRVCVAELADLADKAEREQMPAPALIVVGDVVGLREQLNFLDGGRQPGRKVLVPKLNGGISKLSRLLMDQGIAVSDIKLGEIVYFKHIVKLELLSGVDWLLFTSRHGVEAFWRDLEGCGLDARSVAGARFAALGENTAKCLRKHGIRADLVPCCASGEALAQQLSGQVDKSQKVCYVKAKCTDPALRRILEPCCQYEELEVYENQPVEAPAFDPLCWKDFEGICFTCASLAERFAALCGEQWGKWAEEQIFYSIGPKTTEKLEVLGAVKIIQAEETSMEALVQRILWRTEDSNEWKI